MLRLSLVVVSLVLASCAGVVVHEAKSPYSHIQVIDHGAMRSLRFAGSSPLDVVETVIDRREPQRLQHAYAQAMASGFVYRPQASSVLLIGLGGGALVHFVNHHFPEVSLDVVEIDATVVAVARDYFGVRPNARTRVFIADGYEHILRSQERYDLVLMDAHLLPSALTDSTGHPLTLKSAAFYGALRERLQPGGLALFNMLAGEDAARFFEGIRAAFAATDVLRPPNTLNAIVIAGARAPLPSERELVERARMLDTRGSYGFAFEDLVYWRGGSVLR